MVSAVVDEVRDGAELIDWIVAQPWSAGMVGATGASYDGALASLLVRNHHPALKAIVLDQRMGRIRRHFSPGGLQVKSLLHEWSSRLGARPPPAD
jgi:putative CocE/NonD family hydrolase